MRLVIAVGGNALLRRGEVPDAHVQLAHIRAAAAALAPLLSEHEVLLVHGNGPQVGLLASESSGDATLSRPYPLDALGAQTQGMVGYWLCQALANAGLTRPVVAIVTQTVVSAADGAFDAPDKPIGAVYSHELALARQREGGWSIASDGNGWRRTVASPRPVRIVEQPVVLQLLQSGTAVLCAGGGGSPVVTDEAGHLRGVEAVVDKDRVASLLAVEIDADELLVLTDVAQVVRDFGTDRATPIHTLAVGEIRRTAFAAGSMGPKVAACADFTAATGRPARIGALTQAGRVLAGRAGTVVVPDELGGAEGPHPSKVTAAERGTGAADRIVVGVDGSTGAGRALQWAMSTAAQYEVPVEAVLAWEWGLATSPVEVAVEAARYVEALVAAALLERPAAAAGRQLVGRAVEGDAASVLTSVPALLLVLGQHGESALRRRLLGPALGSVASHCLSDASLPVAIVPAEATLGPPRRVVVGVDGSAASGRALRWAVAHGRAVGAPVIAVQCWQATSGSPVEWGAEGPQQRASVSTWSQDAGQRLRTTVYGALAATEAVDVELLVIHQPAADGLLSTVGEDDVLVVGDRGQGGFRRLLLGSVSRHCVEYAACPVVIVPLRERQTTSGVGSSTAGTGLGASRYQGAP